MKKVLIAVLCVISFASLSSADYLSGWKYITSIAYDYNNGNLYNVDIYGATTPSGTATVIASISNTNILNQADLKNILANLEKAKEDVQKTHITINGTSSSTINAGSSCRIDHEDN